MDIYYINTVEQTVAAEEYEYTVNEYGKREQWKLPYEQVLSKFFKKLSDVSADLVDVKENGKHYYMTINITDTEDNILKKDKVGKKQDVEPKPVPPESEE